MNDEIAYPVRVTITDRYGRKLMSEELDQINFKASRDIKPENRMLPMFGKKRFKQYGPTQFEIYGESRTAMHKFNNEQGVV
jgi:hypothetical protein